MRVLELTLAGIVLATATNIAALAGGPGQGSAHVFDVAELLRGIARLDLAYWGTTAPDSPASWLAQWDGPAIPQLVRIRLTFAKGDGRHWPDMIVAPQSWSPAI